MTEDPRVETIRDRILHGAYDSQGSRHHPRCRSRSAKGDCDCYMQELQPALDALASLARDAAESNRKVEAYDVARAKVKREGISRAEYVLRAEYAERKAALAEAVVEAAERVRQTTPGRSLIVRGDVLQRLYDETAAFRAEFPADPQEKP